MHFSPLRLIPALALAFTSCTTTAPVQPREEFPARLNSAIPLTADDLAGIMSLRLDKFQIPDAPNNKGWDILFYLERAGMPVKALGSSWVPASPAPFLVGYKMPPKGAAEMEFHYANTWSNTMTQTIPNPPAASRSMKAPSAYPIKPGRNVLMLWRNSGQDGWDPGDANFIQRIVIELKVRL